MRKTAIAPCFTALRLIMLVANFYKTAAFLDPSPIGKGIVDSLSIRGKAIGYRLIGNRVLECHGNRWRDGYPWYVIDKIIECGCYVVANIGMNDQIRGISRRIDRAVFTVGKITDERFEWIGNSGQGDTDPPDRR